MTRKDFSHICISAGASGGHIFPALAVALELKKTDVPVSLQWIGTTRSREKELCRRNNISFSALRIQGMPTRPNPVAYVIRGIQFVYAVVTMIRTIIKRRPTCILSFGGYVCAPVLCAGLVCKVPFYIQEQNTVAGKVNRLFSRWAACSFLGFEEAHPPRILGIKKVTGNPVRATAMAEQTGLPSQLDPHKRTLFICGGSQGALSMNLLLVEAMQRLMVDERLQLVWQTGTASYERIRDAFESRNDAFVLESIDDMYPFYESATLLIARAGAMTIAEAGYFNLPMVLIPLPWATDNHQWENAQRVQQQGWGVRVAQNDNTGVEVEQHVRKLLDDASYYERVTANAKANAQRNAAETIVTHIRKSHGI